MSGNKIAIFPASGGLGGSTYTHLIELVDPKDVILICRSPDKINPKLKEAGVTARAADYDKPETLKHAFDGVSYLMLISYPSPAHLHRSKAHKLAIDAARRCGVSHITYSSLAFGGNCEPNSAAFVMQAHLDTERYLASIAAEDKSFTYTAIREGIYSESYPFFSISNPVKEIKIPHDGSGPGIAWAKQSELGEATANLVAQHAKAPAEFEHLNKTVPLSGPRVWSLAESVEAIAKEIGKPVVIRQVSVEEYTELPQVQNAMQYVSGNLARDWATAWEAIRAGETAVASPLLASVLSK
ncbi:NmrA-like family protein [Sphaerosporella brunnea]|uniref:NmrA-like family protein n=1 Tax=Sphaerosporella brunnea TaxID=1250544 RepID=A0A5J5ESW5_9PEZI|nr:NmrA-like family protein [Sphaerosporella brunnea]